MNDSVISGTLKKGGTDYRQGYLYILEVPRKSGAVDSLMVISKTPGLMEGPVKITGHVRSEYIHKIGVPVYIVPEKIESVEDLGESRTTVTGRLKEDPVCRHTKKGKSVSTILLVTNDGTVPVLLWGKDAEEVSEKYKGGDMLTASGRLRSREYPDKKGQTRTAYELSASKVKLSGGAR